MNINIQLDSYGDQLTQEPSPTISTTFIPGIPPDKLDDEMSNEEGTIEHNIEIEFPQSRVLHHRVEAQQSHEEWLHAPLSAFQATSCCRTPGSDMHEENKMDEEKGITTAHCPDPRTSRSSHNQSYQPTRTTYS